MAEDASSKKFLVSNFNNYKIVNSRSVMEPNHKLLRILGQFTQHGLNMDESISMFGIIDKLPPSWKDFKHNLKHNKDELSLVQLGSHFHIEKSLRAEESGKGKGKKIAGSSSVNMIKDDPKMAAVNNVPQLVDKRESSMTKWLPLSGSKNESYSDSDCSLYGKVYLIRTYPKKYFEKIYDDDVNERCMTGYSSVSKGFQPNFTPKLIPSSQNSINQADPKIQKDYKAEYKKMKAKLALLEANSFTSQTPKTFQPKNKDDDEINVGNNHARNGEWIDITMRKFGEEERLNLLSKYNKIVFELNKCRDELLVLKQAKLDAVTFQIQNTKLTKLYHALQEQLKEEKKINEKWLTRSKKVSQCIRKQIPHQKKKVIGGELFTESSSKNNENENLFVPSSMGYDQEMGASPSLKGSIGTWTVEAQGYDFGVKSYLHKYVEQPGPRAVFGDNSSCNTEGYGSINCGAERKNKTLIEAARTMLNRFWTKEVRIACYTQNRSIIIKRHDKTHYEIFRERIPDISYFYVFGCPVFIYNHKDHLGKFDAKADDGYFLGYYFVSKAFRVFNTRRQQVDETYHVTFDESVKATRFANTSEDEVIDDSSRYPSDEFIHEDDSSRQYQANFDISYYVIPHGRSLSELTQENHVPEVIALNEPDTPLIEDTKGPPDLINTKGTHEKNNRWSKYQHIELVNIIGDPGEGMLTRSMAAKLTTISVSECLFADFLFEIEPKKVSKALKHPGWVDAMQEELNQFNRNKEEGIDYDETFAPVSRIEAIRIFLAFATYMNFKVYQMDVKSAFLNGKMKEVYVKQPPGFESSEFPDYVCKLDKALYGPKQAPKACMMGELTYFLGLQFKQDEKGISIFQEQYTRNLLKKYEFFDSFSVKTPMVPDVSKALNL
ncbi:retrovirus-related pol polyprotein from transposon TNT 1-94 [Tanacetum coccineum]